MTATSDDASEAGQGRAAHEGMGPMLTMFFAFACGALAANLYYAQRWWR